MKLTKEEQFIKDAAAYLRAALSDGNNFGDMANILTTLAHDIGGLEQNDPCFLPRVSGYAEVETKLNKGINKQ